MLRAYFLFLSTLNPSKAHGMYTGLLHLHDFVRWVVLLALLILIVKSFMGWFGNKAYTTGDRKLSLVAVTATHVQALIGFILYFVSPLVQFSSETMSNADFRFWTVEHIGAMLIGVVLITIGSAKAKRATEDVAKFKTQAIFITIGLIFILARIPWDRLAN